MRQCGRGMTNPVITRRPLARCGGAAILRPMQECCVEITGLAYRGSGVGRLDGKVVFVPHTVPGEHVRVRTVKSSRRFDEAELIAVEHPAPERITPICPFAGRCPLTVPDCHAALPPATALGPGHMARCIRLGESA